MSAREANFRILTAYPFFRNRAILDRRPTALIEPPTELDNWSFGQECKQLASLYTRQRTRYLS